MKPSEIKAALDQLTDQYAAKYGHEVTEFVTRIHSLMQVSRIADNPWVAGVLQSHAIWLLQHLEVDTMLVVKKVLDDFDKAVEEIENQLSAELRLEYGEGAEDVADLIASIKAKAQ